MKDLKDFIGNTDAFPILRKWNFFNHAGVSPLPRAAGEALRRYAEQAESTVYLGSNWYADIESLRETAAKLINVSA